MTKAEALKVLRSYDQTKRVRYYYPRNDKFSTAVLAALPTFEYPDWDQRPVSKLVAHAEKLS